jgi:cell division protein ZapA
LAIETKNHKVYEVEIGGISLRLKSSHSEETVQQLVQFVNNKIQQSLSLTKTDSLQTAAILACLNLAEEQLVFKTKALSELSDVEIKAQEILANLESSRVPQVGLDH